MSIHAYNGIPDSVLDQTHTTQDGKSYTIRCNEKLAVDMNFTGRSQTTANSQGWERSSSKYFQQLHQNHPEMFSAKNTARIQNNQAPIVDQKMINHNPQFAPFKGEPLVHHHVGGDGQAVAVPRSVHKGYGEIHNHEKNAGITKNCQDFSQKCDKYAQNNPNAMGKNASQMHGLVGEKQAGGVSRSAQNGAQNAAPASGQTSGNSTAAASQSGGQKSQGGSRSDAVNSVLNSNTAQGSSQHQGRSQSVQSTLSGQSASGQSASGQSSGRGGQSHGSTSGQSSSSGGQSNGSGGQSK